MTRNAGSSGNCPSWRNLSPRKTRTVWAGIFLTLSLNGCSTLPILQTKVEKQRVPESLLVPCAKSDLEEKTYGGAIALAEARGLDVDACNERLNDIRKWSAGSP